VFNLKDAQEMVRTEHRKQGCPGKPLFVR